MFVSYSLSDSEAAETLANIGEHYDVLQTAAWPSGRPTSLALLDAIEHADLRSLIKRKLIDLSTGRPF